MVIQTKENYLNQQIDSEFVSTKQTPKSPMTDIAKAVASVVKFVFAVLLRVITGGFYLSGVIATLIAGFSFAGGVPILGLAATSKAGIDYFFAFNLPNYYVDFSLPKFNFRARKTPFEKIFH